MEVILLERVDKLGQMGDVVKVKGGYARNYLLPQNKALRATKENLSFFEGQRKQLEARNLERKQEAEAVGQEIDGQSFVIIRQAGESGQLYGSVTIRDIAEAATAGGFTVARSQVVLNKPIKTIGLEEIVLKLHPEVAVTISINVARSEEEAERQAAGEDMTQERLDEDEEDVLALAEEVFENAEDARLAVEGEEDGDAPEDDGALDTEGEGEEPRQGD